MRRRLLWACPWSCRPQLPLPFDALQDARLLVCGTDNVPDSDAALGSGALHLGEVHAQLLSLLLGGLRGVRLLLAPAGLLGSLARRLLSLLGCLTGGLLSLLSCLTGDLLGLASDLSCLVGRLTRGLLGLVCRLSGRVLRLTGDLPDLIGHSLEG